MRMKKIFTLVALALGAVSVNAQEADVVYDAIVDGNLAPEFAAVAGDGGGVASNAANGQSVITITKGKVTVTAVSGTTPVNADAGGQQITPGAVIDEAAHTYEVASVAAWNEIKWGKGNQGDIDFSYVTGTGNPYVDIQAEEIYTDDSPTGNYRANYIYYEPDGSKGLPITGLYYKFTATADGAFKVKVWANKGNRFTFVVNEAEKKAQKLYASGYINGVNENGQKKFLSVAQVDSVHHAWIWGSYEAEVAKGDASEKTPEELEAMKEQCEANEAAYQYVIGHGNQAFWGWLTFDVKAGETYWVFQHSSQIGFGGFEYYEGGSAEELIGNIVPDYVYTTNFSTYEDDATGERVTWKGEKIVGGGQFVSTDEEGAAFGTYFQNVATSPRQNYALLPEDVLAHSAETEALTIAVWVKAPEDVASDSYLWAPLLTAYGAAPVNGVNTFPMLALQYRGVLQVNNAGWTDYTDAQNVAGSNTLYHGATDWLADKKWHYYTAVFKDENAKVYIDGEVKNEWNNDGTANTQKGLFSNGAALKYVCLGGNQAWDWADNDAPFAFAKLFIKNKALSQNEIKTQMTADYPAWNDDTAINNVLMGNTNSNAALYNLAGQRVNDSYKGVVIKNGKKFVNK